MEHRYSITADPSTPISVGSEVALTIVFTDENLVDAVINWGDKFEEKLIGESVISPSHTYTETGVYSVTVTDACGNILGNYNYVVVYDPSAGFVTGGGWFDSPECAFKASEGIAGKATFGFVAKYKKGSTRPDGNTEFQFKAGDIKFKSSEYTDMRLVIANYKANYTGTGTINGQGNFGFLVSAIDGDIKGDGIDMFRIKIWDNNRGEAVIYDNNCLDTDDNSEPATALGGGSIVIHSNTKSAEIENVKVSFSEKAGLKVYPNPFTDRAIFEFASPEDTYARIVIYDITGRTVKTVFDNPVKGGVYFNAEFVPETEISGMYIYKMTLGKEVFNGKLIYKK